MCNQIPRLFSFFPLFSLSFFKSANLSPITTCLQVQAPSAAASPKQRRVRLQYKEETNDIQTLLSTFGPAALICKGSHSQLNWTKQTVPPPQAAAKDGWISRMAPFCPPRSTWEEPVTRSLWRTPSETSRVAGSDTVWSFPLLCSKPQTRRRGRVDRSCCESRVNVHF